MKELTARGSTTSYLFAQADAEHLPLADGSVDLVLGSPPYIDARLYLEDGGLGPVGSGRMVRDRLARNRRVREQEREGAY
jgi:hypothetical protein